MNKSNKSGYTEEFKKSAVKLALESNRPYAHTARELGVKETVLYAWIYHDDRKGAKSPAAAEETIRQLRKENARLKMERDILKKTAAYFASESK